MDFQTIRHDVNDGILTITLNRPEHLNAFTVTMAEELEHSFRAVNDDDSVRAVIVTGAGRAFCAGMDLSREGNVFGLDEQRTPGLSDMADLDDPAIAAVRDTGGRCTLAIHDCRKPVIAALNGAAVGIGATMTLAMDRRLMSTSARIGLVFGRIGIVPEACSTWYLPRLVGPSAALDLVLRADILDAETALGVGLVDEIHPGEDLLTRAVSVADAWTRDRSPVAVALSRQMVRRNATLTHPDQAHRIDSLAMFWTSIGDGKEGVAAFLEKRKPDFHGCASKMPQFYNDWIADQTSASAPAHPK
ncbi:crotonase/enoyl-CoA hydratase family protein [Rhodococcus sp. IEGM 1351]|uniref:crotonase/enoyl-CoA hydratase family protein n=1 Tax=Rhodococcus sp. IEGM 1351 TaxID=3047089 RepID=UPI0024B7B5B8|nr:crotonase/enoyl-CoA hydratase family protein [Rhodococcus sp. IEGM 1351]MDI9941289.1 crotonase/enoyl-CoA hydratase family protein [Rhodococcus sp. IEGM 1351]